MAYETEIQIGYYIILISMAIWYKLGGHPEGTYRILRTPYFAQYILLEDGTITRKVFKWSRIVTASPPHFITKDGMFYIDKENSAKSKGRPAWFYHVNNAIPIPINMKPIVIDSKTVKRGYRTEIARRLHSIAEPRIKFGSLMWLLILIVILFSVYYTYQFLK